MTKKLFRPYLAFLLMGSLALGLSACGDDDDPDPIEEEEMITTLKIELTPQGKDISPVTATYSDVDGDGGAPPVVGTIELAPNLIYDAKITLWDESKNPPVDITAEIREEGDDHQFFYEATEGLDITSRITDHDSKDRTVGLEAEITTPQTGSSGKLRITLKHQHGTKGDTPDPSKGETDIEAIFNVVVQ